MATPIRSLVKAAELGDLPLVTKLLNDGENINIKDSNGSGRTAAYFAIENMDNYMLQFLILRGADINISDSEHTTLLMHAAMMRNGDAIKLLLQNKALVDLVDDHGYTALHWAVEQGEIGIMEDLLEAKADVKIENNQHQRPIDLAPTDLRAEIEVLFDKYQPSKRDRP